MRWLAVLLVVLLVGCSEPSALEDEEPDPSDWRLEVVQMDPDTRCLDGLVCLADPDSPRSQKYMDEFGITAITEDRFVPRIVRADGDWIVWDGNHDDFYHRNDIIAYNTSSGQLFGLSMGQDDTVEGKLPHVDDGRVVFQIESENYTGIAIWHAGSSEVLPVPTLPGNFRLHDFEGDWIAFQLRNAGDDSGEYVWNVETGEGYRYFESSTEPEQRIRDVDLNHDSVFFIYQERDSSTQRGWLDHVFQVNLSTRALQRLPSPNVANLVGFEVGAGWGIFRAGESSRQDILEFRLGDDQWSKPFEGHGDCYVDGRGQWVWGFCGGIDDGRFFVYELGSEAPSYWSFASNGTAFSPNKQAFDGEHFYSTGRASTDFTAGVHQVPIFSGR